MVIYGKFKNKGLCEANTLLSTHLLNSFNIFKIVCLNLDHFVKDYVTFIHV